jgi:hypothetical protein
MPLLDNQWFALCIKIHKIECYDLNHFRAKLASTMGRVCDNKELLIITRYGNQAVVMLRWKNTKRLRK